MGGRRRRWKGTVANDRNLDPTLHSQLALVLALLAPAIPGPHHETTSSHPAPRSRRASFCLFFCFCFLIDKSISSNRRLLILTHASVPVCGDGSRECASNNFEKKYRRVTLRTGLDGGAILVCSRGLSSHPTHLYHPPPRSGPF